MIESKVILRQIFFDFLTTKDRKTYELRLRAALEPDDIAQVEALYAEYLKSDDKKSE
ncbi:MAG: hypothetical protein LBL80_06305 [Ruminococcus sp.]|jgi:hypothetical protein|nr:hypothetical protein [Ruminococcus sp.]